MFKICVIAPLEYCILHKDTEGYKNFVNLIFESVPDMEQSEKDYLNKYGTELENLLGLNQENKDVKTLCEEFFTEGKENDILMRCAEKVLLSEQKKYQ